MLSPFYGNVTGTSIPCYHNVTKENVPNGAMRRQDTGACTDGMLFLHVWLHQSSIGQCL